MSTRDCGRYGWHCSRPTSTTRSSRTSSRASAHGRLQVDDDLLAELKRITDAVPAQHRLLVLDAMPGQQAVNVTSAFQRTISLSGAILTKMDGDARGGAALSLRAVTQCPIQFVGVGEKLTDLEIFYPDRMASPILGMGDG